MTRSIAAASRSWPAKTPFRIANHTWHTFDAVNCEIHEDGRIGSGVGMPVYYLNESVASMLEQIAGVRDTIENGADRGELQSLLPPGGARNALDAALWDLEAQRDDFDVWERTGHSAAPVETVFTIGLEDDPTSMADKAAAAETHALFKVKLNADRPVERIAAIRAARPDARLVVDANQGWTYQQLRNVAPKLADFEVTMIEQPLPRGSDAELADYRPPLPLCADESCLHLDELTTAAARYQMINIKLDKTGGLTHALELAAAARQRGLGLMVGCMGGSSIAMAPAHVLAQQCDLVDIDGPLLMHDDPPGGLHYDGGRVSLPEKPFWGMPRHRHD